MANGTAPAPILAITNGPMSTDLSGAALSPPTTPAFFVLAAAGVGTRGTLANPAPSSVGAKAGVLAPIHDLAWFEKIHVLPREDDLVFVLGEQAIPVEVWNAYRARSQSLIDIQVTGTAGVTVDNPDGLPTHYPPTRSKISTVRALVEGDWSIDNVVTWVFAGISPAGTTLTLIGHRLIPFPFMADMSETIEEAFAYLTDILEADDQSEQRVQLREISIRSIEYAVWLNERDAQHANALLQGWQGRLYGVPSWQYAMRLGANLAEGSDTIVIATTDIPYEVGGLVFLWSDPYTWEVLTVESIAAGSITVTTGAHQAWTAGTTIVAPMRRGYVPTDQPIAWHDLKLGRARVAFEIESVA